jgi:ketosteroid isomerase-like protein
MAITLDRVRDVFKGLENGDGVAFFEYEDNNVDWTVEGTHPLAGHYRSKSDFRSHTFDKLDRVLPQGTQLRVEHALVSGDWAVVELHSLATAKNGLKFDNRYCWVCRLADGKIALTSIRLSSLASSKKIQSRSEEVITTADRRISPHIV